MSADERGIGKTIALVYRLPRDDDRAKFVQATVRFYNSPDKFGVAKILDDRRRDAKDAPLAPGRVTRFPEADRLQDLRSGAASSTFILQCLHYDRPYFLLAVAHSATTTMDVAPSHYPPSHLQLPAATPQSSPPSQTLRAPTTSGFGAAEAPPQARARPPAVEQRA